MFSIDQNSHSLWDALPKLQALGLHGHRVTHFIEDIDVAFTAMGAVLEEDTETRRHGDTEKKPVAASSSSSLSASPPLPLSPSSSLRLARERFHRSGGADWGAAMFYSEFLGRLPMEIREWEPYTGLKTAALAKQLGRGVDDLYDELSPGDNWQLIGPSYVGDHDHHRTVGDLAVAETGEFLKQLLDKARANTLEAFPAADAQLRTAEWFETEEKRIWALTLHAGKKPLVELYRQWLDDFYLYGTRVTLAKTSDFFATTEGSTASSPPSGAVEILELFTRDYDRLAGLYNQAVEDGNVGLRPLETKRGELPFFGIMNFQGHQARCAAYLVDRKVHINNHAFKLLPNGRLPVEEMARAGISCLAGKAILLVIQARYGRRGQPLALPYRGSMYMPASYRFQALLAQNGLLAEPIHPVMRVRFHLLDRMKDVDTAIHLPAHLRGYFGRDEVSTRELAGNWAAVAAAAGERLERFKDADFRQRWQEEAFADVAAEIAELDRRRHELARTDPKGAEIRGIWQEIKTRRIRMLDGLLRQIACDVQARELDYWDSRGAILPWCIAMGGREFYNDVLRRAEIYEERV